MGIIQTEVGLTPLPLHLAHPAITHNNNRSHVNPKLYITTSTDQTTLTQTGCQPPLDPTQLQVMYQEAWITNMVTQFNDSGDNTNRSFYTQNI